MSLLGIARPVPFSRIEGISQQFPPLQKLPVFHTSQISLDLTGPSDALQGRTLLMIIDYYSRYPEAYILSKGDVNDILLCLIETFARYGLPATLTTDNGSVFRSEAFNVFLRSIGTKHIYSSNYHPCANSTVERLLEHLNHASGGFHMINGGHYR